MSVKNKKNKLKSKIPRDEILSAIYEKFGTLDELGDELGISKQAVSDNIGRQSPKFMKRLARAGVNVTKLTADRGGIASNHSMVIIKDDQADYIRLLKEENERLKERIRQLEK